MFAQARCIGFSVSLSAYDPSGMLSNLTTPQSSTDYLYDGDDLIAEYQSGAVLRRYIHGDGPDEPVASYEGAGLSTRYYLHADERGSVVAVSDATGAAVATSKYSVDGASASLASEFGFTGQLWLPSVQLYYFKARMYSPQLGRFMQRDPLGYAAGLNLYAYAGGDPVNARDPSGLDPKLAELLVSSSRWTVDLWIMRFVGFLQIDDSSTNSGGAGAVNWPGGSGPGPKCPESTGLRNNETPVPFKDDFGNPIVDIKGEQMLRPAGWDPHAFTEQGAKYGTVAALANFRTSGAWDAQRMGGGYQGGKGKFHSEFVDFANVNIGLYASAAGISEGFTLSVANHFAFFFSNMGNATRDKGYSSLRAANVFDIRAGYKLQRSGAICTPR